MIAQLQGALRLRRWRLLPSATAIQPVIVGANDEALRAAAALHEQGIWVPAIRPPTVPADTARLRITLSAAHTAARRRATGGRLPRAGTAGGGMSAQAKPTAYFVTGTDTEIGKTLISGALLHALTLRGVRTAGMKPVAAGAELRDGVWHNEDADFLAAASSERLPPALTTPYLLREATAPHIAAAREGVAIEAAHILACYAQIAAAVDAVVVEGVGGFRVPFSERFDTADLAQQLALAGDAGGRAAAGLHQPCAVDRGGDRRARPACWPAGSRIRSTRRCRTRRRTSRRWRRACRRRCWEACRACRWPRRPRLPLISIFHACRAGPAGMPDFTF